jgi:Stress up-regulated Nod 19
VLQSVAVRRLGLTVMACVLWLAVPAKALAAEETLVFQSHAIALAPYQVVQDVTAVPSPNVDGYVVGMSVDLVDGNGVAQTGYDVMLHHAVFAKVLAPDYTCSRYIDFDGRSYSVRVERFYGAGEEHARLALPPGYGYRNLGTDVWGLVYMLMNHRNRAATVFVRYTVRYVTGASLVPVRPVWLDVRNCWSDPVFNVPGTGGADSEFARTSDFVLPESGRLVAGLGHLHGGGLRLELEDASCGSRLFTSLPTWSDAPMPMPVMHEPGPMHMSGFANAPGIPVSAGDTLRLRAVYDDAMPHTRVMGIMLVYLAPGPAARCEPGPPLAPDPESHPGRPPHVMLPLLRAPRGPLARNVRSTWVGDYRFGRQRISLRRGTRFTWLFVGPDRHDVTLANGPEGFSSPGIRAGRFSFRFTRPGVYNLYCSLHPTRMTQRIIVR